jgi:hypothetical protein
MSKETPVTNELEVIKKPRKPRAKKVVVQPVEHSVPQPAPQPTPQNRLKNIPLSKAQRETVKEPAKETTPKVKRTLSPIVAKGVSKVADKGIDKVADKVAAKVADKHPLVVGSLAYLVHVLGAGLTVAALLVVGLLIVSPKAEASLFELNSSESVTSLSYSTNNAEMDVTVTEADNVRTTVTNKCIRESTSKLTCSREVTYETI